MTEMMSCVDDTEGPGTTAGLDGLDDQLITQLVDRAQAGGLRLTGEGGVPVVDQDVVGVADDLDVVVDRVTEADVRFGGRGEDQVLRVFPRCDRIDTVLNTG